MKTATPHLMLTVRRYGYLGYLTIRAGGVSFRYILHFPYCRTPFRCRLGTLKATCTSSSYSFQSTESPLHPDECTFKSLASARYCSIPEKKASCRVPEISQGLVLGITRLLTVGIVASQPSKPISVLYCTPYTACLITLPNLSTIRAVIVAKSQCPGSSFCESKNFHRPLGMLNRPPAPTLEFCLTTAVWTNFA
ncbi:hypothetical protein N656DRAFT_781132 [Canariomyces notabilis]|uniref:Uncharacterized protein n=1 Tax=Canariomyces notabilis TaxID=2074819 RepID=A0AAN6QIF3_9PEZI|nr:hypothetical protein N656DRAFT_781132 [Canariomyces arenarius]